MTHMNEYKAMYTCVLEARTIETIIYSTSHRRVREEILELPNIDFSDPLILSCRTVQYASAQSPLQPLLRWVYINKEWHTVDNPT